MLRVKEIVKLTGISDLNGILMWSSQENCRRAIRLFFHKNRVCSYVKIPQFNVILRREFFLNA